MLSLLTPANAGPARKMAAKQVQCTAKKRRGAIVRRDSITPYLGI